MPDLPTYEIDLPEEEGKWLQQRIAGCDAEIRKLEENKANNAPELAGLYDGRIETMRKMRQILEERVAKLTS